MAFEYEDRGISEFLQNLALVADQDTIVDNSDLPTLMTLHAVKGLEFNRVFIVGLDDGTLPHVRSLDDPEEMAEERRLFYVGMTRARNELTLVRSERRMNFGSIETTLPSRFLNSIPENLIQVIEKWISKHRRLYRRHRYRRYYRKPHYIEAVSAVFSHAWRRIFYRIRQKSRCPSREIGRASCRERV